MTTLEEQLDDAVAGCTEDKLKRMFKIAYRQSVNQYIGKVCSMILNAALILYIVYREAL